MAWGSDYDSYGDPVSQDEEDDPLLDELTQPSPPTSSGKPVDQARMGNSSAVSGGNYIDWVQAGFPGNYDYPKAGSSYDIVNPSENTTQGAAMLAGSPTPKASAPGGRPSGGSLTDPSYVDQLLAYWGSQPGVNPSVRNDPGYWRNKILSGELGPDESYIIQRFMTPEGPPAGAYGQQTQGQAPPAGATQTTDPLLASMISQLLAGQAGDRARNQERSDALWKQIQEQLGKNSATVDDNDPIIKGQTDSFRNEQTRASRSAQAAAQEARAYRGIPTGSADSAIASAREGVGINTGNFNADLKAKELTARRNQLQSLYNTSAAMLGGDQSRELQQRIAAIDAQLRSVSQNNQNTQFYDTFASNLASQGNTLDTLLASLLFQGG